MIAFVLFSIVELKLLSKTKFEDAINFKLNKKNILVTYHPVTLEKEPPKASFQRLLNALDTFRDTHIIFTHANSDKNGRIINNMIEEYVAKNPNKATSFKSLGQLKYLTALQFFDCVVGNSSSGIVEVPSFNIATINIGTPFKDSLNEEQKKIKVWTTEPPDPPSCKY